MLAVHAMLHTWPATSKDSQEASTPDLCRNECHHKLMLRWCFVYLSCVLLVYACCSAVVTVQDSEAGVAAAVVAEGLADLGLTAFLLGAFDMGVAHQHMKRMTCLCYNSC